MLRRDPALKIDLDELSVGADLLERGLGGAVAAEIRAQGRRIYGAGSADAWGAGGDARVAAGACPAVMLAKACGSRP